MAESSNAQLEKTLDKILAKMEKIDEKLMNVVRVEERLNMHNETLMRYGKFIDSHEKQIHDIQLESVKDGNIKDIFSKIEKQDEIIEKLAIKVDDVIAVNLEKKGTDTIVRGVVKWVSGIAAAVIVFIIGLRIGK